MNETSIKTEKGKHILKTALGMLDFPTITTIAIWIIGAVLVFNLNTIMIFTEGVNLILFLLVVLYVCFMVVTMHQTTIIHLLKERKEK